MCPYFSTNKASQLSQPHQTCTHPGDVTQFDEQIELQRLCDAGKKTKAARTDGRGGGGAGVGFSVRYQRGVSEVEFLISPRPENTTPSDAPPGLIRWLFIQKFMPLLIQRLILNNREAEGLKTASLMSR